MTPDYSMSRQGVRREAGAIVPTVRGRAWITGESLLWFTADDPYRLGLPPLFPRGPVP